MFRSGISRTACTIALAAMTAVGLPHPAAYQAATVEAGTIPLHHGSANAAGSTEAAEGAFTCDFGLSSDLPMDQVAPAIERDRMYMAARPGMLHKHIPLRIDTATGNLQAGGRYLFRTADEAEAYKSWVENEFALDGTSFLQRPYFLNPDCHAWNVIGASNLGSLDSSQIVLRTERWSVPEDNQRGVLKDRWPAVLAEAQQRGLTGVWLLYNKQERLVSLVYFADRVGPKNPLLPDFASLTALELAAPLGQTFAGLPWTRTFDRTQWVLTIWFPFVLGDHGRPSLWPNSPPLPEPYSGDGVCEVSRGEDAQNSPSDCPATCGNGVWDSGEDTRNCPGDCRLWDG